MEASENWVICERETGRNFIGHPKSKERPIGALKGRVSIILGMRTFMYAKVMNNFQSTDLRLVHTYRCMQWTSWGTGRVGPLVLQIFSFHFASLDSPQAARNVIIQFKKQGSPCVVYKNAFVFVHQVN